MLLASLLALHLLGTAQSSTGPDIGGAERSAAIEALAAALRRSYVFPEVAEKAERAVRSHLAAHEYDGIGEGQAFAARLTEDLRAVCHDAHLRVGYSREILPARAVSDRPSAAEIAEEKRREREMNAGFVRVERLPGNIGLIRLDGFFSPQGAREPLRAAMTFVRNTSALLIDVRMNHGGEPETVQLFCSYLFERRTHLNDMWYRDTGKTTTYWTSERVAGPKYLGRPVYVLVGPDTGSAAEEFAYDLQALRRGTIVGAPTWGGANPGDDFRLNDHFHAFIPTGRAINPVTGTNWEGVGVKPDVRTPAPDAQREAHRLALEGLLKGTTDARERERLERTLRDLATG